jgi:hypothetical protein
LFIVITCCELANAAGYTIAAAGKTPSPTLVEVVDTYQVLPADVIDSPAYLSKTEQQRLADDCWLYRL